MFNKFGFARPTLTLIGIDGAEGKVFRCCQLRLGQHVEEGALAHVWKAHDSSLQIGAHSPNDDGLLFFLFLLLGRHLEDKYRL